MIMMRMIENWPPPPPTKKPVYSISPHKFLKNNNKIKGNPIKTNKKLPSIMKLAEGLKMMWFKIKWEWNGWNSESTIGKSILTAGQITVMKVRWEGFYGKWNKSCKKGNIPFKKWFLDGNVKEGKNHFKKPPKNKQWKRDRLLVSENCIDDFFAFFLCKYKLQRYNYCGQN